MKSNWSLTELYESFDSIEFQRDYSGINDRIIFLKNFASESFGNYDEVCETVKEYLRFQTEFGIQVMRLIDYCELSLSTDADNREPLKYIEAIESALTETTVPETKFALYLRNMDDNTLDELINSDEYIKKHGFFLREAKKNSAYILSESEESIISKMEQTGSSAWIKYQDNLISTLMVDINVNGEQKRLPLPEIRNMAYESDCSLRKTAYEAELAACESVAKACAAALSAIKGEVLTTSELRRYDSPLDMTLINSRIDKDTLNALVSSIRKNIDIFTPYFSRKAAMLGHEKLPFYDLFAPVGKADFKFTYEQAIDYVVEKFSVFSPALGEFAQKAAANSWIDVYPKEGKRGGAFCQNLHYIKESRVLLNFTGSFSDVLTLAHELGHAYHGECLSNEEYLNSDYPMPIAETASTLCETIVVNAALKTASKEQSLEILENDISASAQVIVDILSRFIFESRLFEARKNGSLSAQELCGFMLDAQKEAYCDGLDHDFLHKYMWVVKPHYYSSDYNFYNFPYAFGHLLSKGLYAQFSETGDAFTEKYKQMLAASGRSDLHEVAEIAGIDIRSEDFWNKSLSMIKSDIDRFLAAT